MIAYIANLNPHQVQDTVSINEARRLIIELSKPMADIAQNINVNLQVMENSREELLCSDADLTKLSSKLKIPVVDLIQETLPSPITVCTAQKCIQVHSVGLVSKINYVQKCHDPCFLNGVQAEILNNPALIGCWAMNGSEYCQMCGCSYKSHMHIYYVSNEVEVLIEDETIKELISRKADSKTLLAQSIKNLEIRSAELQTEKDLLTKTVAKFAIFLKNNAIALYNDSFEGYLELLISNERAKHSVAGARNEMTIEGLEKMLVQYREEKDIYDQVLNGDMQLEAGSRGIITANDIMELEKELYAMKNYGQRLKTFREGYAAARAEAQKSYSETVHAPPKTLSKKGRGFHWLTEALSGGVARFRSYLGPYFGGPVFGNYQGVGGRSGYSRSGGPSDYGGNGGPSNGGRGGGAGSSRCGKPENNYPRRWQY